jgi:hypothetical protein
MNSKNFELLLYDLLDLSVISSLLAPNILPTPCSPMPPIPLLARYKV